MAADHLKNVEFSTYKMVLNQWKIKNGKLKIIINALR